MADTRTTLVWVLKDQVSASALKMGTALDQTGAKATKTTGFFTKLGSATGGLVNPTYLAIGGITAFTGFMFEAAKAAADEEQNIAKLTTSLYANIPGFDGNTAAIEKTIAARENLAFSDDELRNSLASLVGSTHDVDKALAIQQTAMDLARFKGISLQEATDALIRVEGGQYRALKGLGIVLGAHATQTEALTAVQAVASGQAAAYGSTLTGQTQAITIKLQDLTEEIGKKLLPILVKLADFMLTVVIPVFEQIIDKTDLMVKGFNSMTPFLSGIGTILNPGSLIPHAAGGSVQAGVAYRVGEGGPETFISNVSGQIKPNGWAGDGGDTVVQTTIKLDGKVIAQQLDKHLYRRLQRSPATIGSG